MDEQRIKTIIADGNETSGRLLTQLVCSNCPEIEIVSVCNTLESTVNSIKESSPRLIFIETELPDGNSFNLLQNFPERNFRVVFVTGKEEFAIRAFRFSASGYLLKPVNLEELIAAVAKVRFELAELNTMAGLKNYQGLPIGNDKLSKTLVVSNSKGFTVLKTEEIIFLEADGYCTNFYLAGDTKISSSHNLKYYSELLPAATFMRVHHSFIVNLNHVKAYNTQDKIMLAENLSCSLSAAHKSPFLNYFKHKN